MKFDYVIGNPPYQQDTEGTSDKPIYNVFMDAAYEVGEKVMLITPARFLFDAGKTPKSWNQKMLHDSHFKVMSHEHDSNTVFPNTNIMGGVAITYRDANAEFGEIGAYSASIELNSILHKIVNTNGFQTIDDMIVQQNRWDLNALYQDYPEYRKKIGSGGLERRLTTPIFSALSVFSDEYKDGDLKILGLISNKRCYRYIQQKYIDLSHKNLFKYKVIVPASNGSGPLGGPAATPLIGEPVIGEPNTGFTQSFISFGELGTYGEAESMLKYIKTKLARTLLGILKVTQHNHKGTWKYVPLQDFTPASDIDWSQPIPAIDRQLYHKYNLTDEEIAFIESHVKEMA